MEAGHQEAAAVTVEGGFEKSVRTGLEEPCFKSASRSKPAAAEADAKTPVKLSPSSQAEIALAHSKLQSLPSREKRSGPRPAPTFILY